VSTVPAGLLPAIRHATTAWQAYMTTEVDDPDWQKVEDAMVAAMAGLAQMVPPKRKPGRKPKTAAAAAPAAIAPEPAPLGAEPHGPDPVAAEPTAADVAAYLGVSPEQIKPMALPPPVNPAPEQPEEGFVYPTPIGWPRVRLSKAEQRPVAHP
jgi:hypothetical protein